MIVIMIDYMFNKFIFFYFNNLRKKLIVNFLTDSSRLKWAAQRLRGFGKFELC